MSAVERASNHWGKELPDWVLTLAEACDNSSQKKVSTNIGYSTATVNRVLGNKYTEGDLNAVKKAVEGALMNATVHCPVLGEMKSNECMSHQRARFMPTNSTRVKLFKACRNGCPQSRIGAST